MTSFTGRMTEINKILTVSLLTGFDVSLVVVVELPSLYLRHGKISATPSVSMRTLIRLQTDCIGFCSGTRYL